MLRTTGGQRGQTVHQTSRDSNCLNKLLQLKGTETEIQLHVALKREQGDSPALKGKAQGFEHG